MTDPTLALLVPSALALLVALGAQCDALYVRAWQRLAGTSITHAQPRWF